jgi:sec-independent protein translocase protein TatB
MFGLSFSELLVILVVAVLVVGPKDLPRVVRAVGRFMRGVSALGQEIRRQVDEVIGDEEMAELKRLRETIRNQKNFIIDQNGEYQETYDISDFLKDRDPPAITPADADAPHPVMVPAAKEPPHDA